MLGDTLLSYIKKAFSAYTAKPFLFMWGSIVYLFMFLVFLLATFGFVLIYFMLTSVLSYDITLDANVESIPNLIIAAAILVAFIYFMGALNAALAKTYYNAVDGIKTSLVDFYHYGLSRGPMMFSVVLMREFISLLILGPLAAIYYYFLMDFQYMDMIFYTVVLFLIFVIHFLFTPALIAASLGALPFDSFRKAFLTIKYKNVHLFAMFILFAVVWVLNFIPLLQLFTIFFFYPIIYSALIMLVEDKTTTSQKMMKTDR